MLSLFFQKLGQTKVHKRMHSTYVEQSEREFTNSKPLAYANNSVNEAPVNEARNDKPSNRILQLKYQWKLKHLNKVKTVIFNN